MPDKPDKDFNMIIGSEFQDAGIKDAEKGSQQVAAATQQAAATSEQAAQKSTAAEVQSTAAATKATQAEKALAETMRLVAMGKRALVEEIKRLSAARKAAAASGDQKHYEQLTQSLNAAKQALEGVNTAAAMAQISTMQQAQAGMQMAQGFSSLADMAQNAGSNIAAMANQVLALGMAMKAGLGPIGWIMMALQGVQMVIGKYISSNKEAAQAVKDFAAAAEDAYARVADSARKIAEARLQAEERQQADAEKKAKEAADKKLHQMDVEAQLEDERRQTRLKKMRADLDARIALKEEEANAPGGDKAEFELWRQKEEDKFRAQEDLARKASEKESKARRNQEILSAREIAKIRHDALGEFQDKFQGLATMSDSDRDLLQKALAGIDELKERRATSKAQADDINKQMEAMKKAGSEDEVERLRQKRQGVEAEIQQYQEQIAAKVAELDNQTQWMNALVHQNPETLHMALEDQKRWALNVALEADKKEEAARLADEDVQRLQDDRNNDYAHSLRQDEQNAADDKLRQAQNEIALRRAEAEQQAADLAEQWDAKQKETTDKRIAWLEQTLPLLKKNSETWKRYNDQLQQETETLHDQQWADLQKQGRAAQKAWLKNLIKELPEDSQELAKYTKALKDLAAAAQQEKWQRIQQRGTLAQQQKFLQKILANTKEGSAEAERWNQEMHNVTESIAAKELSEMNETFKVSGQYAVEDKRTQYKILHADRAQLEARAKRLREMLGEEHDAGLREQITKALKENLEQQKGLAQATLANTQAARASLKAYQPPEFHHKNKIIEGNLNRLGKAYAKHVRLEEKYAEQGNFKQAARQDRMRRSIGERITKINKDFAGQVKKDTDDLKASSKKETAEAKKRLRHQQKQNQDLLKDSKPKKKKPQDDQQKPRQKTQEQELQQTKAALEQSKQTLQNTQKALDDMQTKVAETLALCSRITAAAESISKAAGRSLKSLKTRTANLESEVKLLWEQVEA